MGWPLTICAFGAPNFKAARHTLTLTLPPHDLRIHQAFRRHTICPAHVMGSAQRGPSFASGPQIPLFTPFRASRGLGRNDSEGFRSSGTTRNYDLEKQCNTNAKVNHPPEAKVSWERSFLLLNQNH
jgi:hypothetical protein